MERLLYVDGNTLSAEFVEKPWIKNSYLRFRDGKLIVTSRSRRAGEKLVSKYMPWISRHYRETNDYTKLFERGSIFYRSMRYNVRHVASQSRPKADLDGDTLVIYSRDGAGAEKLIDRMIRHETERAAAEIAERKAKQIGVVFREIKARKYRKWGACNRDGTITVNYCISMLPYELQEYVVSHEVAHLRHMNHSKMFWATVGTLCPDYRMLRKRLRNYDSARRQVYMPVANLA